MKVPPVRALLAVAWGGLVLGWSLGWLSDSRVFHGIGPIVSALAASRSVAGLLGAAHGHALAALALVAGAWAAWRVGAALLAWLRPEGSGSASAGLAVAFGLGASSTALHGLALAGLWFPEVFILAAAGLLAAARRRFNPAGDLPGRPGFRAGALVAAALLFAFVGGRVPLVARAVDAMLYHFAAPEHFLDAHKFVATPWQDGWHLPLLVDRLYAAGLLADLTEGAKTVNVLWLAAAALTLYWSFPRDVGPEERWWSLAAFLGLAMPLWIVWNGKNDLGAVAYLFAFAGGLWRAVRRGGGWWAVVGLAAAWATLAKPFYAVFLVVGLGAALRLWPRRPAVRWPALLAAAGLPVAVWAVQNWIWLGDPVYPHGAILAGVELPWRLPELGALHYEATRRFAGLDPASWPAACARAARAVLVPVGSVALACAAPWLFVLPAARPEVRWIRIVVPAGAVLIQFMASTSRYMLPAAALLCLGAGFLLARVNVTARVRASVAAASLAVSALAVGVVDLPGPELWRRFFGQISREAYLEAELTTYHRLRATLADLVPPGATAVFVGESRRLEMPCRVFAAFTYATPAIWKWTVESSSPAGLRKKFVQLGATHLVYNVVSSYYQALYMNPGPVWEDAPFRRWRTFFETYATLVAGPRGIDNQNGGFYVWRLDERPHPPAETIPALPGTDGNIMRAIPWLKRENVSTRDVVSALGALTRLRDRFTGIGRWHNLRAYLAVVVGRNALADREYAMARRSGFVAEDTLYQSMRLALHKSDFDAARRLVEEAGRLYPEIRMANMRAEFLMALAGRKFETGDREGAIERLEEALAAQPSNGDILALLADRFWYLGRFDLARAAAGRLERFAPDHPGLADLLRKIEAER